MTEQVTPYDFSPSPVAMGAGGQAPYRPERFGSHPEEVEYRVRNPINQARVRLGQLVINSQRVGQMRIVHRDTCGCRDTDSCTSGAARELRDASIKAACAEVEIRGFLDAAQGVA